jgi:hypothetical protein
VAHPDLDSLLNSLLPFAQQMLSKHGEFRPFAAAMVADGTIERVVYFDGDEHPAANELIERLTGILQKKTVEEGIRAAGICYDSCVTPPGQTEKTDAICCGLERISGESIQLYLPYSKSLFRGLRYGEIFAAHKPMTFFTT